MTANLVKEREGRPPCCSSKCSGNLRRKNESETRIENAAKETWEVDTAKSTGPTIDSNETK